MDIPLRLIGAARSADFARAAADRRDETLMQRCRRRILGLFSVEQACTPCYAA
jgi:hypothetical protein